MTVLYSFLGTCGFLIVAMATCKRKINNSLKKQVLDVKFTDELSEE